MGKTNTDKYWEIVDNVINELIKEISEYVSTLPNERMEYDGIVEHDLRANYIFLENGQLMVNYNYEEEMYVKDLALHEILFLHEEIN